MKLFLPFALLMLSACVNAPQPKTYDEGVWYTYAQADVIMTAGAAAVNDPTTLPSIREPLRTAMIAARPYFEKLHTADLAVDAARAAIAAKNGTQEQLDAALSILQAAQHDAAKPLTAVSNATKGGA